MAGDGDCLYHALVKAQERSPAPAPRHRAGERLSAYFKREIDQYFTGNAFFHLRERPDFNAHFPELQLDDDTRIPIDAGDLDQHFTTPQSSASLAVCQLAALALQVDIHVQCLLEPEARIFPGGLPADPRPRRTIHLLLREGGVPTYDASFVQVGVSGGHYWYVEAPLEAHGAGPDPAGAAAPAAASSPPHSATPGNGQRSELPRL